MKFSGFTIESNYISFYILMQLEFREMKTVQNIGI
jgi:hypothetical protein